MSPRSYTYLNPDFMPEYVDQDIHRTRRASGLAFEAHSMIRTAQFALENDTSGVPLERRGIATTLEIVGHMVSDLIHRCELLESSAEKDKEREALSDIHCLTKEAGP